MPTLFTAQPKPTKAGKGVTAPLTPMKALTAFALHPAGIRFETQEKEEVVVLFVRQHFVVNIPWIILTFMLVIAPTVIFPKIFSLLSLNLSLPPTYFIVGTLFWYLATFGFALSSFIGWFFNIYIVSDERIVDIDFYYLLYKHYAEADLTKIQDISYASGGILAAMFNYGDVMVQTAGEAPNIKFEKVPYPQKIVETIRALIENTEGSPL